jgi:hypothetical protein
MQKKDDVFHGLFKHMLQMQNVKDDDFFPNEIIERVADDFQIDYTVFHRQPSPEELDVITPKAFELLLFWVKSGEISLDFFEKFLAILVSYQDKLLTIVDDECIVSMVELIALVDYCDHIIYTTIELFIESPQVLMKSYESIH